MIILTLTLTLTLKTGPNPGTNSKPNTTKILLRPYNAKFTIIIRLECIRFPGESWIYSMGQKNNGLHEFGYNSAESEPIRTKFGILCAKCWGLALADFGCDRTFNYVRKCLFSDNILVNFVEWHHCLCP